ncbi:hypothetical protein [Caballeronia sp. LZ001]|uniref:hypothetical protein n=1 Tax=Caballeronia sp. LZ001 TaxID=3038553 RepID=UPI0028565CA6|nr:hypothetical protein [Caballeronia sp. LZ001]MDR5803493.1 hypothetical protein [Caballeronia sp. LZ001]
MKLQTRTLIRFLMKRIGCENVNQFGIWVNCESVRLGWKDTHNSNKWRKLDDGDFIRPPVKLVQMLGQLFDDAAHIYINGPANLWQSLWGDATDPNVLWPLCRTRFSNYGPWLDETTWEAIQSELCNERTFYETIRAFEGELLLAIAYEEPLTLNHLTEAIALYRLHQITNTLTVSNVDGAGAYRCIQICLGNKGVYRELQSYLAFDFIHAELVKMERRRLVAERSYRLSIGIEQNLIDKYVENPLACIEEDDRWRKLDFDWVFLGPEAA